VLLQFDSREIRAICESRGKAIEVLGEPAYSILSMVADLYAAPTLADLPPHLIEAIGADDVTFRMGTAGRYLHFRVGHTTIPRNAGGRLEPEKVRRVKIISIDCHE
jgi:hypothetical protein